MSTNVILADGVQPSSPATLYTAPGASNGTRIIAFTAQNSSGAPETYNLYITEAGGSATAANRIINVRSIANNATDVPSEPINHLIPPLGNLIVEVSVNTTITFRATGLLF